MNKPQIKPTTRHSRVRQFLRHPLWAPLNQRSAWDRLATTINPLWSLIEARARVEKIVDEAPGVKSLWLKPNSRFKGFRPGQHVLLELEINGARHARCFSFSNAPGKDGLIRITIKQKADGPVSAAAHALQVGQIVRLSQAQGEFAPRSNNGKLLLLSAGSGVTPMMSLLQATVNENSNRDVVIVHCGRTDADMVFANELKAVATQSSNVRVHLHTTENKGRIDAGLISQLVPDWNNRETLLCGPDGFMQTIEKMFAENGRSDYLQSESFGRR
ncbi:MAG: ferredoxin reductase, partial [Arenimonas sp.]